MPFDFAELAVEDMLHIDAKCSVEDLRMLPTTGKPLSTTSAPTGLSEVAVIMCAGPTDFRAEPETKSTRVIAVDFVRVSFPDYGNGRVPDHSPSRSG